MTISFTRVEGNILSNGNFSSWPSDPVVANGDFSEWPSGIIPTTEGNFDNWFGTVISTNSTFAGWTSSSLTIANSGFSSFEAGTEALTNADFAATSPGAETSDVMSGDIDFDSTAIGTQLDTSSSSRWGIEGNTGAVPVVMASQSGHAYNNLCVFGPDGWEWRGQGGDPIVYYEKSLSSTGLSVGDMVNIKWRGEMFPKFTGRPALDEDDTPTTLCSVAAYDNTGTQIAVLTGISLTIMGRIGRYDFPTGTAPFYWVIGEEPFDDVSAVGDWHVSDAGNPIPTGTTTLRAKFDAGLIREREDNNGTYIRYGQMLRGATVHGVSSFLDDWETTGYNTVFDYVDGGVGKARFVTNTASPSLAIEQDPSSIVNARTCKFTHTVSSSNSSTGLSLYMDTTKLSDLDCSVGTHSVDVWWSGTGSEKLRIVCGEADRDITLSSVSFKPYSDSSGIYPTSWGVAGEQYEGNYLSESSTGNELVITGAGSNDVGATQTGVFTSGRVVKLGYDVSASVGEPPLRLWSDAALGSSNEKGTSATSVGSHERWVYVAWTPLVLGIEDTESGAVTLDDVTALEYVSAGPTDWTLTNQAYDRNFYPVTDGLGVMKGDTTGYIQIEQSGVLTSGTEHTVKYTVSADALGNSLAGQLQVETSSGTFEDIASTAGTHSHAFTPSGITTLVVRLKSSDAAHMELTDVSCAIADKPDGWATSTTGSASVSKSGDDLRFLSSASEFCNIYKASAVVASTVYRIDYTIASKTSGTFGVYLGASSTNFEALTSTVGSHTKFFKTDAGQTTLRIGADDSSASDFTIDDVSVVPLTGPDDWGSVGTFLSDAFVEEDSEAARWAGGTSGQIGIKSEGILTSLKMYRLNYTVVANPGGQSDALYWFIRQGVDTIVYTLDSSSTGAKQTIGVCRKVSGAQDSKIVWDSAVTTNADITLDDISIELLDAPTGWEVDNGGMYEPTPGNWVEAEWIEKEGDAPRIHTRGTGADVFRFRTDTAILEDGKSYRVYLDVKENRGGHASPLVLEAGSTTVDVDGSPGLSTYDVTVTGGSDAKLSLKTRTSSVAVDVTIDDVEVRTLGASVSLPNPKYGNLESPRRLQASGETADGTMVVYDKGAVKRHYRFEWDNLNTTEASNLKQFVEDAEGMSQDFEISFADWRPTVFGGSVGNIAIPNLRLESPDIDLREVRNGLFSATLVAREK